MTAEMCIGNAEQAGWRFAGLESSGGCFMGNTLHDAQASQQADCNEACNGDPTELCGGELRTQVYQDSTWFDPNAAQLIAALQEYNDTIAQFLDTVGQYDSSVKQWQSETKPTMMRRLSAWLQQRQVPGMLTPSEATILTSMSAEIRTSGVLRNRLGM